MKNTFKPLHDLVTYQTYKINIDYKRKRVLYNMNCYGSYTARKIRDALKVLGEIDKMFQKNIYVSEGFLEHYFTSPTYKKEINGIFEKEIWGRYPIFTTPEYSVREGVELTPVTRELVALIVEKKIEKQKIERFYRTFKKVNYVPHVKLKHFKILDLPKRPLYVYDALQMIVNGQKAEDIGAYFKAYYSSEVTINGSNSTGLEKITLEELEALESIGYKFNRADKVYQNLKASKVFNSLGDVG